MLAFTLAPGRPNAALLEALSRWVADDLRSLNGQIEFLLRRSLQAAGRMPAAEPERDKRGPRK